MKFGILGPLEVHRDGGETVILGGIRQRALLADLLLHANEVVSTDRLIDDLWGERVPATANHTVQVFVSRLRRGLGTAGARLVTRPPGYAVEVGEDELDAARCEHLHARGVAALAAGDAARADELLRAAEALWRGPPLAEFTYEPFAQAAIARLEELRLTSLEDRIEADLALARHADVVPDLEALVREHPLRERPRGQLMLALYRCGRQADALDQYRQARGLLVEELGVEPGDALRELEQAILRQEPSLHEPPPERAAPAPMPAATVRKTVTVLAGAYSAPGLTDPEALQRRTEAAREEAARIVVNHGGTFDVGLAGALMGIFGFPRAREDDALRALRAADELRSRALATRVGLDTGEVVATAPDDRLSLFGEPLDRVAALVAEAREGEVVLGDATRRLAHDAIVVERVPEADTWRLLELVPGAPAVRRRLETPMVDRERELAVARDAFERANRARNTQLLTVIGDAGLGKSRLARELAAGLGDRATTLIGRCLSYGEGIALWPLREALARAGGDSRQRIRRLLGNADDADLVASVIATALGLDTEASGGEQVPWAFRRLLEVLARRRPVLLVVEDAHWAEPPLMDLVDYLVEWLTTAPVLVLCLGRPELLEARPNWGGGDPRVSSLALTPLADDDALRVLRNQPGDGSLSGADRTRIIETAEGNPLFVEHLLAMRSEDAERGFAHEVPATIKALLAARLDRLGPGERAVVERGAIIGRQFWPGAVVELLPPEARESAGQHLRALVHRGLLRPDRSTMPGEDALRFHHGLIHDVAYRSTPKALRAELHERFAAWLERRGGDHDEFVGYHLEQAFGYRRELDGAGAVELADRGGERLAVAGRRALARGDGNAASKLLGRSARLFEAADTPRPDVLLDLGSALGEAGDFGPAAEALRTALAQARAANEEALAARVLIELSYQHVLVDSDVDVREMLAVAERAIAVFERVGDDVGLSRAWSHVAQVHWTRCRCAEMEEVLEKALVHAERAGDRRERSRILSGLARAAVIGPRPVEDGIRRCNAILERAGDDITLTAVSEAILAVLEAMQGRFEPARERWRGCRRRLEEVGLTVSLAGLQMYCALVELLAGQPEAAEREAMEAYAVLERIGEHWRRPTTAAILARALCAQGRYEEAERFTRIAEGTASKDDVVTHVIWRAARAQALARTGDPRVAEELAASSVALAAQTDFLLLHADALVAHADVLAVLDRPREAAQRLDRAVALYECKCVVVPAVGVRS